MGCLTILTLFSDCFGCLLYFVDQNLDTDTMLSNGDDLEPPLEKKKKSSYENVSLPEGNAY